MSTGARILLVFILGVPMGLIRSILLANDVSNFVSWLISVPIGLLLSVLIIYLIGTIANEH